ncbi:hypothetical protein CUU66_05970 [Peribacillus deserti]|uniref:Uncharacterized protein n=1 Tax=Peribacillus deserti TaxID=673318 RepID=A0A2N5M8L7_9BACI|nr:hypothetical protein CUU66_05970 [Peribacillus deserti]
MGVTKFGKSACEGFEGRFRMPLKVLCLKGTQCLLGLKTGLRGFNFTGLRNSRNPSLGSSGDSCGIKEFREIRIVPKINGEDYHKLRKNNDERLRILISFERVGISISSKT